MTDIIFIHGMFQNAKSWDNWINYLRPRGYHCMANSWPLHEGEPEELRMHPSAGLGDLRADVIVQIAGEMQDEVADAVSVGEWIFPELFFGERGDPRVEVDAEMFVVVCETDFHGFG